MSAVCITDVHAHDETTNRPAIIETGPGGAKTLIQCSADQMPVLTEGPTDEFQAGKRTHSRHGLIKCIDVTANNRNIDAGGSGSVSFTDGRKIEVINCPRGTFPLVWQFHISNYSVKFDPKEINQTDKYLAVAPVLVRCAEGAI
jgi:hypothetical protein